MPARSGCLSCPSFGKQQLTELDDLKHMKKAIKIIAEWLAYLAVFLLIVWGTPFVLSQALGTQYPIASITSGSMWPKLKRGDIVFIRGLSADKTDLQLGDIIVYRNERGFTIHRIVKLEEDRLVTRGDANNVDDTPIEYGQIVGKVIYSGGNPIRIPYLGFISQLKGDK